MSEIASENSCRGFDHKTGVGTCYGPPTALIFSGHISYLERENFSWNKQFPISTGYRDNCPNV